MTDGKDRFNRLAQAAAGAAGVNGAALLGKPNVVGKLVIGVMDTGQVGLLSTDFDPPTTSLLVSKTAAALVAQVGVQVQMKAPPPPEGA